MNIIDYQQQSASIFDFFVLHYGHKIIVSLHLSEQRGMKHRNTLLNTKHQTTATKPTFFVVVTPVY